VPIRRATIDDIPVLIDLLTQFHSEGFYQNVRLDPLKLEAFLRRSITDPHFANFVWSSAETIQGLIVGHITTYFFSDEPAAYDLGFYIRPSRRGAILAYKLWEHFSNWAKDAGAKTLWIGVSSGIDPDRAERFFKGIGMSRAGALYYLKLG
jgi:N-acetylglutamate synthase-like GNAT family acetyltransferase